VGRVWAKQHRPTTMRSHVLLLWLLPSRVWHRIRPNRRQSLSLLPHRLLPVYRRCNQGHMGGSRYDMGESRPRDLPTARFAMVPILSSIRLAKRASGFGECATPTRHATPRSRRAPLHSQPPTHLGSNQRPERVLSQHEGSDTAQRRPDGRRCDRASCLGPHERCRSDRKAYRPDLSTR